LSGGLDGPLGASIGAGRVRLSAEGGHTRIDYEYDVEISGKVSAIGSRMLDGATKVLIDQFFKRLTAELRPAEENPPSLWRRILNALGFKS
jgi:2-furoyl-CoA dehydrogenase large subunit